MKKRIIRILFPTITAIFFLSGCASQTANLPDVNNSFANYFANYTDTMGVFGCYDEGKTVVLDYETMQQSSLCSKPNCMHTGEDCIEKRLHGHAPVFSGNRAYYFVDEDPKYIENADGNPELILG